MTSGHALTVEENDIKTHCQRVLSNASDNAGAPVYSYTLVTTARRNYFTRKNRCDVKPHQVPPWLVCHVPFIQIRTVQCFQWVKVVSRPASTVSQEVDYHDDHTIRILN